MCLRYRSRKASIRSTAPAGGAGAGKEGNYIICNGDGNLEVLESGRKVQNMSISNKEVDAILDRINSQSKPQYVVVGVRPSGYSDFESIRSKLEYREMVLVMSQSEKDWRLNFQNKTSHEKKYPTAVLIRRTSKPQRRRIIALMV